MIASEIFRLIGRTNISMLNGPNRRSATLSTASEIGEMQVTEREPTIKITAKFSKEFSKEFLQETLWIENTRFPKICELARVNKWIEFFHSFRSNLILRWTITDIPIISNKI